MRERERIHGTTKKPFSTYTYRPQKTLRNCIRSKFLIQLRYDCSNGSTHRTYTKSNSATPSYGIHLFQTFTKAQSKQINIFPTHMLSHRQGRNPNAQNRYSASPFCFVGRSYVMFSNPCFVSCDWFIFFISIYLRIFNTSHSMKITLT